jgi:SH3-like domain-containing protein
VRSFPRLRCRPAAVLCLAVFAMSWTAQALAAEPGEEDKLPIPRFVSISSDKANVRTGPGERYPIDWVFVKKGMPVEVVAEFGNWRKIKDQDGSVGWVYRALLSGQRNAIVIGGQRAVYVEPDSAAKAVFYADAGVMGRLKRCKSGWCEITVKNLTGWIPKTQIWGVLPEEDFE